MLHLPKKPATTVTPLRLGATVKGLSENRKPTAEKPFRPGFPVKFVKYGRYSPHLIEKSGSIWHFLVTVSILRPISGLFLVALLVLLLQSCGFHLRGNVQLASELSPLLLREPGAGTEIASVLRGAVRANNIHVTKNEQSASAILTIHREEHRRRVLSVSSAGTVQEFELSYRVNYSLKDSQQGALLSNQWVNLSRDLRFDTTAVLAKSGEETQLKKDMVNDAAQQILRRLQKLTFNDTAAKDIISK